MQPVLAPGSARTSAGEISPVLPSCTVAVEVGCRRCRAPARQPRGRCRWERRARWRAGACDAHALGGAAAPPTIARRAAGLLPATAAVVHPSHVAARRGRSGSHGSCSSYGSSGAELQRRRPSSHQRSSSGLIVTMMSCSLSGCLAVKLGAVEKLAAAFGASPSERRAPAHATRMPVISLPAARDDAPRSESVAVDSTPWLLPLAVLAAVPLVAPRERSPSPWT